MRLKITVATYNDTDRWTETSTREIDMTISESVAQKIALGQTVDAMIAGCVDEHVKHEAELPSD